MKKFGDLVNVRYVNIEMPNGKTNWNLETVVFPMSIADMIRGTETSSNNLLDNMFVVYGNNNGLDSLGIGTSYNLTDDIKVTGKGTVTENGDLGISVQVGIDF